MSRVSARGHTLWLTGLSGAGKTTTANALRDVLSRAGAAVVVVDGDDLRAGLSGDLGFSADDRDENVRRAGEIALLLNAQGVITIVSLISPRTEARRAVRARHGEKGLSFSEIYLATPLSVCEARDPKALYKRARAGEQQHMTGVDDPYEAPEQAEITVSTESLAPEVLAEDISRRVGLL